MKVAIITDSIEKGPISSGNYAKSFIKELLKIKGDNIEIILIHAQKNNDPIYKNTKEVIVPFPKEKKHTNFLLKLFSFAVYKILNFSRNYKILKICEKEKIDVLHIPHLGRPAPSLTFLLPRKFKLIITNHGMVYLALPAKLCWNLYAKRQKIFDKIEYAKWCFLFKDKFDFMITVSNSEKEIIAKKLFKNNKIKVIYHGVDFESFQPIKDKNNILKKIRQRYKVKKEFFLHISIYQPKKNLEGIIKSFAIVKNKYKIKEQLIVIGNHPQSIQKLVQYLGITDEVTFLGLIPHKKLFKFFNVAIAFIFPSFHESFGMPILEAMACGCPVITSNTFACSEVAGDAAILVNPYNIEEIAEAMYKLVTNEKLRKKLSEKGLKRAKQFSWKKCAREHLKVYKEVTKNEI